MNKLKITYIINIEDFKTFLEKLKKINIIYLYFENKIQNDLKIYDYLHVIVIYINFNIYILNIVYIIEKNGNYGIVLLKRFLDIINKYESIKIMFDIKQIYLLYNFIIKYNIRNINKKRKRNYICLNIIPCPLNNINNIKRIDDYYIKIMFLLYNIYNDLCKKNPSFIFKIKNITYKLLNN